MGRSTEEVDLIVKAITEGFEKVSKDISGTGKAIDESSKQAGQSSTRFTELSSKLNLVGQAYGFVKQGIGQVIQFGKESLALFGRQEQAEKQLAATITSTGGAAGLTARELQNVASALQKTTTYGDEATIEMESVLLTFTNIRGEVLKNTIPAILDLSAKMGQDLQSSAVQVGKALNDPIAGITALTRVGVSFTQQQKDQIKAMTEMGDVAGAQQLILAELNKEFGGSAAAAADTYAGKITQLGNSYGDLKEEIGEALAQNKGFIDTLNQVVSTVGSGIANQNEMTKAVQEGYLTQDKLIDRLKEATDAGKTYDEAVQELVDAFHDWEDAQLTAIGIAEDYDRVLTGQIGKWEYATSAAYIMTDAEREEMRAASEAAFANSELADKVRMAGNRMSESEALIRAANVAVHAQNEAVDYSNYTWDLLITKLAGLNMQHVEKEMKRGRDEASMFGDAVENLALRLGALPSEVFVKIRVTREGDTIPGEGGGGFPGQGGQLPPGDKGGDKTPPPATPFPGHGVESAGMVSGQSIRGGGGMMGGNTINIYLMGAMAANPQAIAGAVSKALTPRG